MVQIKSKFLRQIRHVPLKNARQLATKLRLAEGERAEIALNVS